MLRFLPAALALFALTAPAMAENVAIPPTSTPEQIEAFKGADHDSDGALTRSEFRIFIEAMADQGEPTAQFIRTFSMHSIAFTEVDRDRDGYARPFEISEANSEFEENDGQSGFGSTDRQ